jgi:hypothetical protein
MICPNAFARFGLSLCLSEVATSMVLLISTLIIIILWIKRINVESEPLLGQVTAYQSHSQQYQSLARAMLTLIVIDSFVQVILDIFQLLHSQPTLISTFQTIHFVISVITLFAWVICCVFYYFVSLQQVQQFLARRDGIALHMLRFWYIAFGMESVRAYHWILSITQTKPTPMDVAFVTTLFIRFVLIFLLMYLTKSFAKTFEQLMLGESVEQTWADTFVKIKKLVPFLWPKPRKLQLLVVSCFVLLGMGRIVNVLVPYTYKLLVEDLTKAQNEPAKTHPFSWMAILSYTFFRFLQGGVGVLSSLQYFLWIPVGQYTTREICVRMLEHLHSLSLQFHITSKTGEILRVMDRGTSSIGSLLSYLAFNILPVFVDIAFAVVYFIFAFDASIALIVFVTMLLYIFFTIWITEWRTKFRREMNDLDTASRGRAVDSLLNFETVKYFGNEKWEVEEYDKAIRRYQVADWKSSSSLNLLNSAQNAVITLGLLAGLLLCAKRVIDHQLSVGDFVAFITYLLQLYQPLNWFGTYYRVIQQNFVDMEKMLDLFEEGQSIQDAPDATELQLKKGSIQFQNVSFAYDRVAVLDNMSFEVPAGKTYALVGVSGGGKSSILRVSMIN